MIDKNKQYRTRNGREVRIYATDGIGACSVHGAIRFDSRWEANTWTELGSSAAGRLGPHDLIEVKPRIKREVWVNVYPDARHSTCSSSKISADKGASVNRIACVKVVIDCEEGEGL